MTKDMVEEVKGVLDADPQGPPYVGRAIEPFEYEALLRGTARFTADFAAKSVLHAAFVRSVEASAQVARIDVRQAREMPGVVAVLTGAEVVGRRLKPRVDRGRADPRFARDCHFEAQAITVPAMAVGTVQYVGQAVAMVVAESRYLAEDAAEMVEVDYVPMAAVVDPRGALAAGAPVVVPGASDNLAATIAIERGEPPVRASEGARTIAHRFHVARQSAAPLECRGVVAIPHDHELDVWTSSQSPFVLERVLEEAADWAKGSVHVRTPAMGGAFGQKTNAWGEELIVAVLARELDRPIAWIEDRYENFVSAPQGRDQVHDVRLAVDADGRILSWEDDFLVDFGAHCFIRAGVIGNTAVHLLGPYAIPYVRIEGRGAFTNKTPTAQYRGAGRPEAAFALERGLDLAARELGIDPVKIREVNLLGPEALPHAIPVVYRDGASIVYDGENYRQVARDALRLLPDDEVEELRRGASVSERIGVGMCAYVEATGRGPEPDSVLVRFDASGTLEVITAGAPSGQSHRTTLAQIAADAAIVPIERVRVTTSEPSSVPHSTPTAASRTAVVTGNAVHAGVLELVGEIGHWLGGVLGCRSLVHGPSGFCDESGERAVTWDEVAELLAGTAESVGELSTVGSFAPEASTWSMGVHVVAVSVDVETGATRVLRYAVAEESGPAINPRVVEGQIIGGVAQGVGEALLEAIRYDENGQPTTTSFLDYHLPEVEDVPRVRLAHREAGSQRNRLGLRGVGESGIIGGAAAVAAAIDDALKEHAVFVDRVPLGAEVLLEFIAEAES